MFYIKLLLVAIVISLLSIVLHYLNGANISLGMAINIVVSSLVSIAVVVFVLRREAKKREKANKCK